MSKSATPILLGSLLTAGLLFAGCYSPSGGIGSYSGGPQTYYSTELMQKTVTMVDTRTNEVFFSIEIPPGKQLTYNFDEGDGDDPVNTPDIMYYEIMPQGTTSGKLHNTMTVPNAACRKIDITLHHGVEYAQGSPDRQLRTDETADRPAWWSAQGGPLPEDKKTTMYDK